MGRVEGREKGFKIERQEVVFLAQVQLTGKINFLKTIFS